MQAESGKNRRGGMVRRPLVLFCIGIAILFICVWANRWLADRTVAAYVFAEGLIAPPGSPCGSPWRLFRSGPEAMPGGDGALQPVSPG